MKFNYKTASKKFKWDIPEEFNMAWNLIEDNIGKGKKDDVALYWENSDGDTKKFTYEELRLASNKFANALKKTGVQKGDRILFRTPNIPEFMISFLGCVKTGVVPIPSSTLYKSAEVEYRINDSGAKAVLTTADHAEVLEKVNCESLENVIVVGGAKGGQLEYEKLVSDASSEFDFTPTKAEETSFMMYTSGTTGHPKAAVHAHRWSIGNDPNAKFWAAYKPKDLVSHSGELNWIFTLANNFVCPFRAGVPVFLYQEKVRFNPEKWLQLIEKYKITNYAATPTIYRMLLTVQDAEKRFNLKSLEHCISAGEALPQDTFKEWKKRFKTKIFDGIGQTEVMVFVSNMDGMKINPGSCGRPQPGHKVAIINEKGEELPPNTPGSLALDRNDPGLMKEYWQKPEKTAEVFQGKWYVTGDTLEIDEKGYLWFKGRGDDLIKASGYRISPFEVESALASHPAVLESAAVQSPDELRGNVVKAFIILKENYAPSEELIKQIQDHVKEIAAPYMYPRKVEFVKELPKTQSGKIKRKELREAEQKKQ
ncbi:acyl-CoA synthetase [Candidatus Woesearchaeota archaeon]|nr:acyl-CoA synthetase [Candidatus Woesearchaeota archaeon]